MQIVVFKIGKEEYGLNIKDVQEIVRLQDSTKLPNMPEFFEGVINLRGRVIPVLNLATKFKLQANAESDSTRLIVLNIAREKAVAIKADEVTEVLTLDNSEIDQSLSMEGKDNKNNCLIGIAKLKEKLIILLDSCKIIAAQELPKLNLEEVS